MKYWRSQDGKRVLDLTKIIYWEYTSKEDFNEAVIKARKSCLCSKLDAEIIYPDVDHREIHIYIGGNYPLIFKEEEADEIYNILQSQKEVL